LNIPNFLRFVFPKMSVYDSYELVVGLEVHAQLSTFSKAYAEDINEYGALPNTHLSPLTLGLPGTLPVVNQKVVEYAIKMGIATHCTINRFNGYARKNYFYADLPKGYQVTQDQTPICTKGNIKVTVNGEVKTIGITRIHMEEDAGKSMHDQDVHYSLVDLNRAGVPLIEIVSEPDIRSSEEAALYLMEIRKLLRYLEICDGNMEEGSMRCDANISVRKKGATEFGKRCEVKNLNSFRNVQRAIEYEFKRQIDVIEAGGSIQQNTLNFNALTGETSILRTKEMANDYRYFPEPDIPPVILTEGYINGIKAALPMLPEQLLKKFTQEFALPEVDAKILIENKELLHYFESL
jgi:aspartyl-tRNA(Asn)/glutamyl-tRNA(Gln) amidotransferase subunit B